MANYISELISDLSEHYDNHKLFLTGSSNFRNEVAVSNPIKVAVLYVNPYIRTHSVSTC